MRTHPAAQLCLKPLPPPASVLQRGSDPGQCIPTAAEKGDVSVQVVVSARGRAVSVRQQHDLCLTVEPDGEVQSKYVLSAEEEGCILRMLRDWRFVGIDTCWPVTTSVAVGPGVNGRREMARECGSGPTSG